MGANNLTKTGGRVVLVAGLDDAKVDKLNGRPLAANQEEIRQLEVAMHDLARVHRRHGGSRSADHLYGVAHAQRSVALASAEVFPIKPLHGEEVSAVFPYAVGDVLNDARVAQVGKDSDFAREPSLVARRCNCTQKLQRDAIACVIVKPRVDVPHAPTPDALIEPKALGWVGR